MYMLLTLQNAKQEENGYSWTVEKSYKIQKVLLKQESTSPLVVEYALHFTQLIIPNQPSSCDYLFETNKVLFKSSMGNLNKSKVQSLEIQILEIEQI